MPIITTPTLEPSLVKPKMAGLKQFAMSVVSAIFGYWDDSGQAWDSSVLTWGAGIEYPSEKPTIGGIRLTMPKFRHKRS